MTLAWCCLVLAATLAVACAAPSAPGRSQGTSSSTITFSDERRGQFIPYSRRPQAGGVGGGSVQSGETSATSVQTSTGDTQTNQGQATGVSVQKQTGLGGATQVTNNQALVQSLQEGGAGGSGGTQTSDNQATIISNQLQQNVDGTLVNVEAGNEGVVVVNTNDPTGRVVSTESVNNRPIAPETPDSAHCRYVCKRPSSGAFYCCDDGSNHRGDPAIHGGQCPPVRILAQRNPFVRKCAHDGQCAASDKCCYDEVVQHHICKSADPIA